VAAGFPPNPRTSNPIEANPDLLRSAIENVVRNAVRYTAQGTTVEIRLERRIGDEGEDIVVRVLDSGPAFRRKPWSKFFQPFYRIDDARNRQTGGAGLGLSIADRAVRLHGGRVRASNRPEGGLEVEIRIPAAPAVSPLPVLVRLIPIMSDQCIGRESRYAGSGRGGRTDAGAAGIRISTSKPPSGRLDARTGSVQPHCPVGDR